MIKNQFVVDVFFSGTLQIRNHVLVFNKQGTSLSEFGPNLWDRRRKGSKVGARVSFGQPKWFQKLSEAKIEMQTPCGY